MPRFPRLALGSIDPATDYRAVLWSLLDVFDNSGVQVQSFYSQARFPQWDAATTVTGRNYRHLDSWLMDEDLCREVFAHGMSAADVGIVDGPFGTSTGGSLDALCATLDLPRLAVVDVSNVDPCRQMPPDFSVDGIILDGARDRGELVRERTRLELLWGVPVLGGMIASPAVRAIADRLPAGARPSRELCRALGQDLILHRGVDHLLSIANRRAFPEVDGDLFRPQKRHAGLTVAVALDEAFNCYFPDTFDLLELSGATIRDFSPVRDESLPADADVVCFGCGHPERVAESLASNHCMISALKRHVRAGKRIYAEGSGVAYLSRQMILPDGVQIPMCGLLSVDAQYIEQPAPPTPVEVVLNRDSWVGRAGRELRGYLNARWQMQPVGPVTNLAKEGEQQLDLIADKSIIASRLHLNMVGQPHLVRNFLTDSVSVLAGR